ncbi:MAG: tRNA (guanosine(37)-N1)-methyltransferase TrmD [Fibrobacterota bacterium]
MLRVEIITLFPEMFTSVLNVSILGRAVEKGLLKVTFNNIKDYPVNNAGRIDDYPYGGGSGMVFRPEPVFRAVRKSKEGLPDSKVIFFTPQGKKMDQAASESFTSEKPLILLCGHYKGMDQRIRDTLVDEEISIGDYVLTGGELPAMVFLDSVTRLLPGVIGDISSAGDDSFSNGLLGYPLYTRPEEFEGMKVPPVLLSGNHDEIKKWKKEASLLNTEKNRNDLIKLRRGVSYE